ncbi:hypothetical protein BC939DRAFT_438718 [Gamsiella multidivaricata]|uniref:uncharacterized protein n=1 Tax=Gamsiella multidivaricata TaxID=101098 RepID=UPI00221F4FC0|nr:uncharacterized protein BC939DRAFT_438718 [Gamsiella multidivaricata]KAI7830677.1 hypothetical protein BC939DRAFT_438718 [Gamsiella multidivaricata]
MSIWFVKAPPTLEQIIMEDLTTYWDCNSQAGNNAPFFALLFVYDAALLLLATYLGYKNRNVAANYNECRQIAFVVYNILLSGCIAMPTVFLPQDQFLTKFFLTNIVLLFGTTVSLMFMFLPKLWKLFSQIEYAKQTSSDGAEDSSFDGLFNNQGPWLNTVSGNGNGAGSTIGEYPPGARKGSIGSIEDSKAGTLKESHLGYMGVKFQNRYLPFLASWCMRRVILFPADKHFTAFETGRPEAGRTYTYKDVSIYSREPDSYILRVIGCGRFNFLLQVKDEERLLHWHSLFGNKQGNTFASVNDDNATLMLPDGNLSGDLFQTRSEHDQTLGMGYSSHGSRNTSDGSKYVSGDEGCYFSRATRGPYGLATSELQQHRHTASSYTMVTFTTSPCSSLHEIERPYAFMDSPSQQTTLGVSSADSGTPERPLMAGRTTLTQSSPTDHTHPK